MLRTILLSSLPLFLLACTVGSSITNGRATVVPRALETDAVALPAAAPVAVVAGPARDAWFRLAPVGSEETEANLAVWSQQTAAFVARELSQRGVPAAADAGRQLQVTVVSANGEQGAFKCRVDVRVRAETGDGTSAEFTGSTSSVRGVVFCAEDALAQAVQQMLSDARIRAWLGS